MSTAEEVATELRALGLAAADKAHAAVVKHGALLQTEVQRNASGRPGPNVITGDYRRSINRRTTRETDHSICEVGSDSPQAARLEIGFRGTDSRGRVYDQPAFPHYSPALDTIRPGFEEAVAEAGWVTP